MSGPQSISDFVGEWQVQRVIRDAKAGQIVHAEGLACLVPADDGLTYDETVTLRLPGQNDMTGTRRYLWRKSEDGIAVHFDDGRFFHSLTLGGVQASDHHDCPPDSYDAAYDFSRWPVWSVRWTVTGPRKSYEMETEYRLR